MVRGGPAGETLRSAVGETAAALSRSASTHLAFVGVGANLGQPGLNIERALEDMRRFEQTVLKATSAIYRSAPEGGTGPDYANAVARLETALDPWALLRALQAIELQHGRTRPFRHAPRTLDLDLLLFDDAVIDRPGLQVPHPRMHERVFVLQPLLDVAPEAVIPGRGSARACLSRLPGRALQPWEAAP